MASTMPVELQQGWRERRGLGGLNRWAEAMARAARERPQTPLRFHGSAGEPGRDPG
jgi:hypothetical protein